MANESTYNSISAVVNSIWQVAFLTASENSVVQPLVENFSDSNSLTPRKWTTYTGGTVQTIAETDDMTAQTFNHAVAGTFTPAIYGAQYFLTDARVRSDWRNAAADAGQDLGRILADKVDTDLVGLFASLTGGTVGTAGGTLTWANVFRAAAYLRAAYAPMPYYVVMRPEHWYYLAQATSTPTLLQSPEFMNSIARQFYVGGYGGIQFFIDANITSGTAAKAAMFSRQAMGMDLRQALRIETQRDASRGGGGYELNATLVYDAGIYRATFGCQMIGTSS